MIYYYCKNHIGDHLFELGIKQHQFTMRHVSSMSLVLQIIVILLAVMVLALFDSKSPFRLDLKAHGKKMSRGVQKPE